MEAADEASTCAPAAAADIAGGPQSLVASFKGLGFGV